MKTLMIQISNLPITPHSIQLGMLFGMVGGLVLMALYPKGRPNEVFTWVTALLSVASLATYAYCKQFYF
jgi:hypothetical protein